MEYYINEKNVLRMGLYTNFDNDKAPDSSSYNREKVDMYGVAFGYSIFTGDTMITLGANWAVGYGKAQIIEGSNEIYDTMREAYFYLLAVSFNID